MSRQQEERTPATGSRREWVLIPSMLGLSSLVMAFAWLGHLRLKQLPLALAILFAWAMALPEYAINVYAIRRGYGPFSGGQMAAFRLSAGVVAIALVARFFLGEELSLRKIAGFALMIVAMSLIATSPHRPDAVVARPDEGSP